MKNKRLWSLVLAAVMALSVVPYMSVAAYDVDAGLVLHYTFDSDSSNPTEIKDTAGNGLNGEVLNTTEFGMENKLSVTGGVASFPGYSRMTMGNWGMDIKGAAIKIPEELKDKIDGDYTVSMWVKPDSSYYYADKPTRFFDFGASLYDSIFLRYTPSEGNLFFQDRGIVDSAGEGYIADTVQLNDKWSMVTVSYRASNSWLSVYINGEEVMSSKIFTRSIGDLGSAEDNYGLFLGRTQWINDQSAFKDNPDFKGYMDEVRIYNRFFETENVELLYNETFKQDSLKVITSDVKASVKTNIGEAPILPETINVTFDDATEGAVFVKWDEIDSSLYEKENSFTVTGEAFTSEAMTESYGRIALASVTVKNAESTLENGLAIYYSFENDEANPSVITDDSGSGKDATVLNNSDWGNRQRKISVESTSSGNKYGVFPGKPDSRADGAAVRLPDDAFTSMTDYTVSMWVNATSDYYYYHEDMQRFFDFGSSTTDSIFVRYVSDTEELRFQDRGIGTGADDSNSYIYVTTDSFKDKWGLLTVTYTKEDSTATVYINGEEVMKDNKFTRSIGDLSAPSGDSGNYIGRTQWWNSTAKESNPDFKGGIDEVRIYDRALSADEVSELYAVTNPEIKIDVNITHSLEDGTVIEEKTVSVGENSSYTYAAPETAEYEGKTYHLSKTLSQLSIDSVNSSDCSVNAVYVIKTVLSAQSDAVSTYVGVPVKLPETAVVRFNTGDEENITVTWDEPEKRFDAKGEYSVTGTALADDEEVTVEGSVVVYAITQPNIPESIYTNVGSLPQLPEAVDVTLSAVEDIPASEPVIWNWNYTAEEMTEGAVFEVDGYFENCPDEKVKTTVYVYLISKTDITAVADAYISTESGGYGNYGGETGLKITSTGGGVSAAGYDRMVFLRFPGSGEINPLSVKLKTFVQYIDNNADVTYTLLALDPEEADWDEYTITWNNSDEYTSNTETVAKASLPSNAAEEWLEFDITDYVNRNRDLSEYNFCVICDTCATYCNSREAGENPPTMEYDVEGQSVTVNYVCGDKIILTETVAAPKNSSFVYENCRKALVEEGKAYVYKSGSNTIDKVDENNCTLTFEMEETSDISFENITVSTYFDEKPEMPSTVKANIAGTEVFIPVEFNASAFSDLGVYEIYGDAEGMSVPATVKAYGRYYSQNGMLLGYAGRIVYEYMADGEIVCDSIEELVRVNQSYETKDMLGYYPQLTDTSASAETIAVTEPVHTVVISGTFNEGVSGFASASLSGENAEEYTLSVDAAAANTAENAAGARVIIVKYDNEGKVIDFKTKVAELSEKMTGRTEIAESVSYDRENGENISVYLWDSTNLRPLAAAISAAELPDPERYSEEVKALIPQYETVRENVERANNYRQSTWGYSDWVNNIHPAFWDTAAYHTGNMEAYFTFGNEEYKQYSANWAESNGYSGNTYSGDPSSWTWGYNQSQGSNAVLFGDWQICFQSYLDLNLLDPESKKTERTFEVMSYQITKSNDDFWWWADALYMVTPVMTKMYLTTGNEAYLDALYKYYRFSAELMYDGELGIPTDADGYTTSAYTYKNSGSYYSDPNDYKHLFFRDAGYVYPLNPNSGHEDEKNFWARGNGWVFAGLAKILNDLPTDYENYGFFLQIYTEMAKAIIDCQMVDSDGRGYWTQSMLQDYPKGSNGNSEGYETSGTAFFTYGLFWGLNSGVLSEQTYLEPALRGWKYLSEVALQESGKVGYCQPIGSNATQATAQSTDQPFGYGAFLLAGCEASRWVGGVTRQNAPYLARKLWNSVAINGGKYYAGGQVIEGEAAYNDENGVLYVPLWQTADLMGFDVEQTDSGYTISNVSRTAVITADKIVERDETEFVPATTLARAVGKYVTEVGSVTVISHKSTVFFSCEEESEAYLNELLM